MVKENMPQEQLDRIKAAILRSYHGLREEIDTGGKANTIELVLDADRPMLIGRCSKEDWSAFCRLSHNKQNKIAADAIYGKRR